MIGVFARYRVDEMDRPAISPVNIRVKPHITMRCGWWVVHSFRGARLIQGLGNTAVDAFENWVSNQIPWGIHKGGPYFPNVGYRRG